MSIFYEWGFSDTPFLTTALNSNEEGEKLLVGRNKELKQICTRLNSGTNVVTLEGANGIGKTSLINVAIYKEYSEFKSTTNGRLLIACERIFQIKPDIDVENFIDEVYMSIAQTLISKRDELASYGRTSSSIDALDKWLNHPQISAYNGTIGPLGLGKSTETNTSLGFQKSGFRRMIDNCLTDIFPSNSGAIVCIIDNIELLETSDKAKKQLEYFRDCILRLPGLRWVLCGALGIIRGVLSSPRLQGILFDPIEVEGIKKEYIEEILTSRICYYSISENAYLPLNNDDFARLYTILDNNIRNCLNYANNYCIWISDEDAKPLTYQEKGLSFEKWLIIEATKKIKAVNKQLSPKAKQLFPKIISINGTFSPSDYKELGFENQQGLRHYIRELEKADLVNSTRDDSDSRRKTVQVTPEGWFLSYALTINKGFNI